MIEKASSNHKLHILLIDNQQANEHIIVNLLKNKYRINIAHNDINALNIIRKEQPDIILFDVSEIVTSTIVQKFITIISKKEIPIILLLDNDNSIDLIKFIDLGMIDYINKPLEPNAFMFKIALWAKFVKDSIEDKKKHLLLEQYKSIVDKSAIVSKADINGMITYVNDKFCEISGYSKEELLGKSHSIIRHPEMSSKTFEELWKNIKSGKSWFGKVKNRKKNGDLYCVDTVITPIIDRHGNIAEYIALRYDITELESYKDLLKTNLSVTNKDLEENLIYMQQYEEAISSVTAVLKTDTNNIITYANPKFCELIGYQFDELIGQNCSQLRDEKHRLMFDCENIKHTLKNKNSSTKLLTSITKDGAKLHINTFFHPILDSTSNVVEHLQIMHDATEIVSLNDEIIDTQKEIILTVGTIGETRSKETGLHVRRVAEYSYLLAKLAGLTEKQASIIKQASPMHDIGKVAIPDNILNKPGKLTIDEFEIMKTHSSLGYEMLKYSKRELLQTAALIAYTHHEKYDGSGYPNSLVGEEIPIEGRITAIADVFDALGTDRVYKKAWELKKIIEYLKEEKSKHFDPILVNLFLQNIEKFLVIQNKYSEELTV